jgi:hypothetical protein
VAATAPTHLFRRPRLNSSTTISSVASCPPAPIIHQPRAPKTPNFEYLPHKLSWLKDTNLELWIDQEGFRAIRASFRLVGYSELARSLEPFGRDSDPALQATGGPSNLHAGIVDFVPVKRQIFIFHRSTLDSSPVLRRITVNGDEGRDYLSRQASLTLKNGVYIVRGHETSSLSSLADGADSIISVADTNAKLKWKLEYIVRDRRAEATGKILSGEKTLTPLTFSCSPLLLHSLQGKKVRLMHIVKKSVTTNILAEKLEPPRLPTVNPLLLPFDPKTNTTPTSIVAHPLKKQAWGLHRRAYSHAMDENTPAEIISATAKRNEPQVNVRPVRRRRASSAGERTVMDRVFQEGPPGHEG